MPWRGFYLGDVAKPLDDFGHDLLAFADVGQLTSAEDDRDDDLILVGQKLASAIDLHLDVMFTGLWADADLLDLAVMDVPLVPLLLLLVVLELAKVHDPADRRALVRGHLDQIQFRFAGGRQGLIGGDNP